MKKQRLTRGQKFGRIFLIVVVILFVLMAFAGFGARPAHGQEFEMSVESQYLGTNAEIWHDEPVFKSRFFVPLGEHWYVEPQIVATRGSWGTTYGHEQTTYVGFYTESESGWFADIAFGYAIVSDPDDEGVADILLPYLAVGKVLDWGESGTVTWSLIYDGAYPARGNVLPPGEFFRLRVDRFLARDRVNIVAALEVSYDTGTYGLDSAIFAYGELHVLWRLKNGWSLGPGLKGAEMLSGGDDYRRDQDTQVFLISLRWTKE